MADLVTLVQHSYVEFLAHGRLPPTDTIKLLVSKMLGYGILVFSVLVKLPQVANVVRAQSADGLSAVSFELESWGLLVHTAYGYLKGLPFSTYGEASMLFAQNLLLLGLIYKYARLPASRRLAALVLAGGTIAAVVTGEHAVRPACNGRQHQQLHPRSALRSALHWPLLDATHEGFKGYQVLYSLRLQPVHATDAAYCMRSRQALLVLAGTSV
eukprot:GHRR01023618.1.p1 GENE.GHRR01023618.1~~GHRR01023618.1.p1  ORF type:complete len:213 (+),score=62.61 GHRR01023618.1:204-842(+)